jgi:hypothetical protein
MIWMLRVFGASSITDSYFALAVFFKFVSNTIFFSYGLMLQRDLARGPREVAARRFLKAVAVWLAPLVVIGLALSDVLTRSLFSSTPDHLRHAQQIGFVLIMLAFPLGAWAELQRQLLIRARRFATPVHLQNSTTVTVAIAIPIAAAKGPVAALLLLVTAFVLGQVVRAGLSTFLLHRTDVPVAGGNEPAWNPRERHVYAASNVYFSLSSLLGRPVALSGAPGDLAALSLAERAEESLAAVASSGVVSSAQRELSHAVDSGGIVLRQHLRAAAVLGALFVPLLPWAFALVGGVVFSNSNFAPEDLRLSAALMAAFVPSASLGLIGSVLTRSLYAEQILGPPTAMNLSFGTVSLIVLFLARSLGAWAVPIALGAAYLVNTVILLTRREIREIRGLRTPVLLAAVVSVSSASGFLLMFR